MNFGVVSMNEMESQINMDSVDILVVEAWKLHWEHCAKTAVVVQIWVAYTQTGTVLWEVFQHTNVEVNIERVGGAAER